MFSKKVSYVIVFALLVLLVPGLAFAITPVGAPVDSSNIYGISNNDEQVGNTHGTEKLYVASAVSDADGFEVAFNDFGSSKQSSKEASPLTNIGNEEYEVSEGEGFSDPLEGWNRAMFAVNDKLYFWFMKPVAQTYGAIVPEPFRMSFSNFFYNAFTPVRLVNALLQGKFKKAGEEIASFGINSTVGILGLGDIAGSNFGIAPSEEDFGQTLGRYGIGNGCYLVLPFFGPSSARDTIGFIADSMMNPITWAFHDDHKLQYSVNMGRYVNKYSLKIGEYENFKSTSVEPYTALKNAYYQYRKEMVNK
ncbi:MAG: VacJ family lipoprotein [Candidatus Magnetoovum sp. WYHC-5]|nr:VacJ family lipoprotein [Candidatus Magnetoovum sp. WYHC-5]